MLSICSSFAAGVNVNCCCSGMGVLAVVLRFTVRSLGNAVGMLTAPAAIPMPSMTSLGSVRPTRGRLETFTCSTVVAVCGGEAESVSVTLKSYPPATVGVPLKTPAGLQRQPRRQCLGRGHQRGDIGRNAIGIVVAGQRVVRMISCRHADGRRNSVIGLPIVEFNVAVGIKHCLEVCRVAAGVCMGLPTDGDIVGIAGHIDVVAGDKIRSEVGPKGCNAHRVPQHGIAVDIRTRRLT